MRMHRIYNYLLVCLLLISSSICAQKNYSKSRKLKNNDEILVTGWYPISENKGTVTRRLSHKNEIFKLIATPIVLWSDVETIRYIDHNRFNYGAILIALKKEKIEELKNKKTLVIASQWGLIVNNELVLVQDINKQQFSGNFQVATQENIEWLKELYENIKLVK